MAVPAIVQAAEAAAGAKIGSSIIGGISNIGGGSSGSGGGWSYGTGTGGSASQSWNNYSGYSDSYGESSSYDWSNSFNQSDSQWGGESWQAAENWAKSQNESRVFGQEASARDKYYADEANREQWEMWKAQADFNKKEAEIAREYQTYMSNTAYQRAVADLISAGLNPILAVGNMGASTPVGAMATTGLGSSAKGNAHADSYSRGYSDSYGYSNGGSRDYGYSKSYGESSSYGQSKSYNKSHSQESGSGGSTSSSKDVWKNSSKQWNKYTNNAKSALEGLKDMAGAVKEYFKNPVPTPTH